MTTHPAKLLRPSKPAEAPKSADTGGGLSPGQTQDYEAAKSFADDATGQAVGITADAMDMRTAERTEEKEAQEEERLSETSKRRQRELELFGEQATAMPAHGGRDNVPEHFGGE